MTHMADAMAELCREAGVDPRDGTPDAGRAVLAAAGPADHPWCPLTVRARRCEPRALVTDEEVVVPGVGRVPLCPAWLAAVRVLDRGDGGSVPRRPSPGRATRKCDLVAAAEGVTVPCPDCGAVRVFRFHLSPGMRAKQAQKPCRPCSVVRGRGRKRKRKTKGAK